MPLSPMDRSFRQNINKEMLDLNHILDQIDLTDIYRSFHPTAANNMFFSSAHKTFFKADLMTVHRTSLMAN